MEQRIVCAAIRYNKQIIVGVRHFDTFMVGHIKDLEHLNYDFDHPEQGFVDNKYQFLTRQEAWVVAEKAGQIVRDKDKCVGTLFSEHLY
jgi:hypothetical protein